MDLRNCKHVESYLRKRCPKYNAELIEIGKRGTGSTYSIILIMDGKLYRMEEYGVAEVMDRLVPKLNEYFDGKPFDTGVYYVVTDGRWDKVNNKIIDVPVALEFRDKVFRFESEPDLSKWLELVRDTHPTIGVNEVPKPVSGDWISPVV